ncbi:MAG: hypothetical protein ACJ71M_16420 [Nitrososphaeraceae archaeon]
MIVMCFCPDRIGVSLASAACCLAKGTEAGKGGCIASSSRFMSGYNTGFSACTSKSSAVASNVGITNSDTSDSSNKDMNRELQTLN